MPEVVTLTAAMVFKEPVDAAALSALSALVVAVRAEPGCLSYTAHLHAQDSRRVLFYERWQDDAALAVHAKATALTEFRAAMEPRLAGPSELNFWRVIG
jgi:quinol monooxygenase YgiN